MKPRCLACGSTMLFDTEARGRVPFCPRCRGDSRVEGSEAAASTPVAASRGAATASASRGSGRVATASLLAGVDPPEMAGPPAADPGSDPSAAALPWEPGNRAERAAKAARRYGLTMSVALMVADNKLTLTEALERKAVADAMKAEQEEALASWIGWAGAFAAVVCALIGAAIWTGVADFDGGPVSRAAMGRLKREEPVPTIRSSSEVRTDAEGRVTGIRALDPESVLATYCRSIKAGATPLPVRIDGTTGDDRRGVFKLGDTLRAIEIRKDPGSVYWLAGNDKDPIVARPAAAVATIAKPSEAGS